MENQTLVKEKNSKWRPAVSLKADDLKESINKMIDEIQKVVKENNLTMLAHDGTETSNLESLKSFNSFALVNLSKNAKKKIMKKIYRLEQKMTLTRMNRFIGFICNLIPDLEKIKVLPSKSEQDIIVSREKYTLAKQEFFKAKTEFKTKKKEYRSQGGLYFV